MPKKNTEKQIKEKEPRRPIDKEKAKFIIYTVLLSLLLLVFYHISMSFSFFPIVMWGYMIILTALILVYLVYNRGFSRMGVTREMLPESWDEGKKAEFIESGKKRIKRSRWLLMFIVAFAVTFLFDAFQLFVIPIIGNWF